MSCRGFFFHLLDSRQLTWAAISSGPKRKATKPRPAWRQIQLGKKKYSPRTRMLTRSHTYVNGTNAETNGYAVTQNTFLQ